MLGNIFQPIEKELRLAHNLTKSQLTIKAGSMDSFAHLEFSDANRTIRPALVILAGRTYGGDLKQAVMLASIFQFIYMASKVHEGIPESDSDFIRGDMDPRDGSQFPVLVGDFLYGKFFAALSFTGMISLLNPLAEIICRIHEGGILEKKLTVKSISSQVFREVVRKKTAVLFAGCCSLSARIAGATDKEQEQAGRFGQSIGMAYGFMEQGMAGDYLAAYFQEALASLTLLPNKPERVILEQLTHSLSGHNLPARKMVI